MQYKSPIPLILHAGFAKETLDVATVLKIQKLLLVELDHTGTGHVQVGDQQFTKDDILTVTEEIKDANTLNFHNAIFDNPELLQLLEHGTVTDKQIPLFSYTLRKIPHFQEFRDFVSPFLVQSVAKGISQSIQKKDFASARKFVKTRDLIVDSDFDRAFGKVKTGLKSIVHEIERTSKKEIAFSAARFDFIKNYFVDFMNELPDGLAGLRDEVGTALVNLSVPYQRSHAQFCDELYSYLKLLDCSESLKTLIQKNAAIVSESTESVAPESGSSFGGIGTFIFVFFAFVGLLRVCSRGSNRGSSVKLDNTDFPAIAAREADHYFFEQALRSIALRQLTPKGSDSVKNLIAQLPAELKKDDQPYASDYGDLRKYKPSSGSVVHLTNRTQLDAIVFVRNDDKAFSAFLHQKETIAIQIADLDRLSFYFGSDWKDNFQVNVRNIDGPQDLTGIFANIDSITVNSLNNYYQFDCDSICSPVRVELKSGKSEFVFEADKPELFNWEKGIYFIKRGGSGRRNN